MNHRVGVVGYSGTSFDVDRGREILNAEVAAIAAKFPDASIVSGLTALGVPLLAYEAARKHGLRTVGIACGKSKDYECFPCDEVVIVGENWGDESDTFLGSIDAMLKVGGGKQSIAEYAKFTGPKKEWPL